MRVLLAVVALSMFACTPVRKCSDGCLEGTYCDEPTQLCVLSRDAGSDARTSDAGTSDAGTQVTAEFATNVAAQTNMFELEAVLGQPRLGQTASSSQFVLTTEGVGQ